MPPHYASLHAGLLARKGEAAPALRTAPAMADTPPARPVQPQRSMPAPPPPKASPSPAQPVQARSDDAARTAPARARTTVRMTGDEQRRLRLAANKLGRSQQSLMQAAIAAYLEQIAREEFPECGCLKPRK